MRGYKHPKLTDVTLAEVLHALGDETRLKLVRALMKSEDPLNCNQTGEAMQAKGPSSCHYHLRIMRDAGLIHSERKGVSVENKLRKEEIQKRFPGLLENILSL